MRKTFITFLHGPGDRHKLFCDAFYNSYRSELSRRVTELNSEGYENVGPA